MSAEDNKKKSNHGANAQKSLAEMLNIFKSDGYISHFLTEFRIGRDGFDDKQFYAPFLVSFLDGEKWAVFSTTSYRSDRLKGTLWDCHNLKDIDSQIKFCFLVYPNGIDEKETKGFLSASESISEKKIYSALDEILSQSEFSKRIENKYFQGKSSGSVYDAKGRIFENRIAQIMSNSENLNKLKNNDRIRTGIYFDAFCEVIKAFNLDPSKILSINATADRSDIGFLPSGGQPKTDVLVNVTFVNGNTKNFTISCKRTNNKSVTVHQYKADDFANVLCPENEKLRRLLNDFQNVGGIKALGNEKADALTEELKPYLKKLSLWVFGGDEGDGSAKIQYAQYILTYSDQNNSISVTKVKDYYNKMLENNVSGQFGTVFNWTFASKSKGKNIQLKAKII